MQAHQSLSGACKEAGSCWEKALRLTQILEGLPQSVHQHGNHRRSPNLVRTELNGRGLNNWNRVLG